MPDSSRCPGHVLPALPFTVVLPGRRWGHGAQSALVELLRDRAGHPGGDERPPHARPSRRQV